MEQRNSSEPTQFHSTQAPAGQQIIINQQAPSSNGLGTAGFVLALLGLILCWVPMVNFALWILGLILSLIGVFKRPRGLAIAGLVLSFISVLIIIAFLGALGLAVSA